MPEYLSPGVHINEVPSANKAIQGVSTTTAGMVGITERGPVGVPTLITSAGAFEREFGGLLDPVIHEGGKDALPHAIEGFFANGGSQVYVVRVIGTDSAKAGVMIQSNSTDALGIYARSEGAWGNALQVTVSHASRFSTEIMDHPFRGNDDQIKLASTTGLTTGTTLAIGAELRVVKAVLVDNVVVLTEGLVGVDTTETVVVESVEFDLLIEKMSNGVAVETELFTGLSLNVTSPVYVAGVLGAVEADGAYPSDDGDSAMVRAHVPISSEVRPNEGLLGFTGGSDGTITPAAYIGKASEDPAERSGIHALVNKRDISLVAIPGQTDVSAQKALLTHCEQLVYRFAVLDMPKGASLSEAREHRNAFDSSRAALYYPWLIVAAPFGPQGELHAIPPSGHLLGIYARSDNARGVWKAPANEVVRNILSFDFTLTKAEQDILNPVHVNCLRDFRAAHRGLRVWGARTLSSDPEWKYVPVRRTFLFIEQSLVVGLQWVVFEPNGELSLPVQNSPVVPVENSPL